MIHPMLRDVDRSLSVTRHYPGYPSLDRRVLVGPYTIHDLGWIKAVWRHGWRLLDDDGIEVLDEARNVCRRLQMPGRLPQ